MIAKDFADANKYILSETCSCEGRKQYEKHEKQTEMLAVENHLVKIVEEAIRKREGRK